MLLNVLLAVIFILIALHAYCCARPQGKNFALSISIRIIILVLFLSVILGQYDHSLQFAFILMAWVIFEVIENIYKKKIRSLSH